MQFKLSGLIAATFTPMHGDGTLNLGQIEPIVEHLIGSGVAGLYVCGTTGEGPSLSAEEREAVAEAHVAAARGRIPVVVQVGHTSLPEACRLAAHACDSGADAISAIAPWYFKPASVEVLARCLAPIAASAPNLPFYYYHLPAITRVYLDMVELLRLAPERLPTLAGIKYSVPKLDEFQACTEFADGRFDILFGCDEMLLSGLASGARGAVGSTYNYLAPLYRRVIDAFERTDLDEARRHQGLAVKLVQALVRRRGHAGLKAAMQLVGLDCGPTRLPLEALQTDEVDQLREELDALGFFQATRIENIAALPSDSSGG
jgi:N-acetylneuraminate lyase